MRGVSRSEDLFRERRAKNQKLGAEHTGNLMSFHGCQADSASRGTRNRLCVIKEEEEG